MNESVLDWMDGDHHGGGINLYTGDSWEHVAYRDLRGEIFGAAEVLRDRGVRRGDRVALVLPTCREFPRFFFGALAAGAVPTVLPAAGLQAGGHTEHLAKLVRALEPSAIIAQESTLTTLGTALETPPRLLDAAEPVPVLAAAELCPPTGAETSIIQFTSGSTGSPRAVRLDAAAVVAHIDMLRVAFRDVEALDARLSFGSWLPMHHDMGLIGMFLSPVMQGHDVWLMRPEHFVRRPAVWLDLFGRRGVRHSAIPNFAIERMVRLVGPKSVEGMDFSRWRTLVVGSDRINFAALRAFYRLLAPHGLAAETVTPGYGMAETTLAVSMTGGDQRPAALRVEYRDEDGQPSVEVVGEQDLVDDGPVDDGHYVVSCGAELPGSRVLVVGPDGEPLADGRIGEVTVESPALFSGYLDERERDAPRPRSLSTGDLGFRYRDDVYILGRIGNAVKVNGTYVTSEDLELSLAKQLAVNHDKVTVVLQDTERTGKPATLVVIEQRVPGERVASAFHVLRRAGLSVDHCALFTLPPLAIPRTTSGKPRRAALWANLASGKARGKALYVGAESPFNRAEVDVRVDVAIGG